MNTGCSLLVLSQDHQQGYFYRTMEASNGTELTQHPKRDRIRPIITLVSVILDIYAVVLIVFLGLTLLPWRHRIVEMLVNLLHLALLPSLFLFIVYIALRRWRSAALWVIPTIAFLVLFGSLFLPGAESKHVCDPDAVPSCMHLRVMTFNMHGQPKHSRQPQIDMIRDSGADIVALQEVDQDGVEAIEAQLADLYPYQVLYPRGIAGTGVLSKYPIEDQEVYRLSPGALYHTSALIDVDGVPINLISAHPMPPLLFSSRGYTVRGRDEIGSLIDRIPVDGPALLMGDFNHTDQSRDYRLLIDAGMHDTFREVGWGFGLTWPAHIKTVIPILPTVRIDYIWHSDEFEAQSARVGPRVNSDHLPVIADLVLVP